jgi:hypothetical protein
MKARLTFGILFMSLILSNPVWAQITAYANILARVVEPVSINNTNEIAFPEVSINDFYPVITGSESVNQFILKEQGQNRNIILASFCISKFHQTFDIMLPKESIMIGSHGTHNMTVHDFNYTANAVNSLFRNMIVVNVGARWYVPEDLDVEKLTAQYSFLVTLNYN